MMHGGFIETLRRLGNWLYVLIGGFVIVAGYFIVVHQEHLAAYSGIIFLLIFVVLHLFMHSGHGHHVGSGDGGELHEGHG